MHTLRAQREADLKALVPPVQVPSSPYSQSSGGATGNSSASVTPTKIGGSGAGFGWGTGPAGSMDSQTIFENVASKTGQSQQIGGGGYGVDSDDENENRVQSLHQSEEESESELKEDPITVTTVTMSLDSQFTSALSDGTSPSTITPSITSDGSRSYPPTGARSAPPHTHTHTRPSDLRVVTGNGTNSLTSSGSGTVGGGGGGVGEGGGKIDYNTSALLTPRGNTGELATVSPMNHTVTPLSFGADRLKSLEALSVSTPLHIFESLMTY